MLLRQQCGSGSFDGSFRGKVKEVDRDKDKGVVNGSNMYEKNGGRGVRN